jgi:hypothetical protein
MCGVEALVVASMVSSTLGVIQQAQYARAVNDQQQKIQDRNTEIAKDSFNSQSMAVNERLMQERDAAAAKMHEVSKRAMKAAGTLRTTAGGMGGGSLRAAYQDVERQELAYRFGTERGLEWSERQSQRAMEGLRAGRAGQELRGVYTPMEVPNFIVSLGRIATEGALLQHQLTS